MISKLALTVCSVLKAPIGVWGESIIGKKSVALYNKTSAMGINDRTTMFFGAKPLLFERARYLRENMTPEEHLLWSFLKNKENTNCHFRCQHPIYQFIADFYCHKVRLAIEVDGGIHLNAYHREYDICRDYELSNLGIKVCRFSNDRIHNDFESVKH